MTDTVNKQRMLNRAKWIRDTSRNEAVREWFEIFIEEAESGAFSEPTPSTPVQGYREELEWYGDEGNYKATLPVSDYRQYISKVQADGGERARQALSQTDIQPSGWIPVSVAPQHRWYLVSDGSGIGFGLWQDGQWYAADAAPFLSADITHYMPMPHPPGINSTEDDQPVKAICFQCRNDESEVVAEGMCYDCRMAWRS